MNEQDIYIEAMNLQDNDQRHRFLDDACGTNRTLRARVKKLIQHADRVGSFLESSPLVSRESSCPAGVYLSWTAKVSLPFARNSVDSRRRRGTLMGAMGPGLTRGARRSQSGHR